MRRSLPFALSLLVAAAACGPAEVVVSVEVDMPNPEGEGTLTQALPDIEVQLVPFDRDALFEQMAADFGTPEPEIPQELLEQRQVVQEAQAEWDAANRRWATIRDTLQKLNDAMEPLARGEARYVALFREWQDWDSQYGAAEREVEQTFEAFNEMQLGTIRASDSVRILQDNWADEAFADIGTIFAAAADESGLDWVVDTTDASGIARGNLMVAPGQYWVHARYELAYTELYWNVPITVEKGEPVTITLNRSNAEERIKL